MFRPKIGLVLGGGGPKGLAHIGVIKTLVAHSIPIDYIAGTSAGALIGGMYACTADIASLESYIMDKNKLQMVSYFSDVTLRAGFIEGNRIEKFLDEYTNKSTFKKTKIPFAAVAVDLKTGNKVVLRAGSVTKAIRASIAIPVLFRPVEIDDYILVDGGLISSVPVESAFAMGADIVIAVQLDYRYDPTFDFSKLNPLQVGEMSLDVVEKKVAVEEMKKAQIILRPHLEHVHWSSLLDEKERQISIEKGVEETQKNILKIKYLSQTNKFSLYIKNVLHRLLQTS